MAVSRAISSVTRRRRHYVTEGKASAVLSDTGIAGRHRVCLDLILVYIRDATNVSPTS